MTEALYRSWRPKVWSEVKYQTHVVQTLKNAITADKVAHAYIFSGPRGTGKTTAARLLAKAINCQAEVRSDRPCNQCEHCASFNEYRYIDLIEIDAASHTGVDDARDLIEKTRFLPSLGDFKIYIIDEVHMLSKAAFNALLKTIEEPPPHVYFILATTELDKVMPTILSRCQRFEFRRFPLQEITDHLATICAAEGIKADEQALASIARNSGGGMRDAISLLDQLGSTGEMITLDLVQRILGTATSESVVELVSAIADKEPARAVNIIHEVLDRGASPQSFSRQVVEYLRSILLVHTNNESLLDATSNMIENIKGHAGKFNTAAVLDMLREFNNVIVDNRMGWSPSLNLEMAIARATNFNTGVQPPTTTNLHQAETRPATSPEKTVVPIQPTTADGAPQTKPTPVSFSPKVDPTPSPAVEQTSTPVPPSTAEESPNLRKHSPSEAALEASKLTIEQARKAWEQVDQLIFKRDKNYQALFKSGKLREVERNTLVLVFPSEILANKFDSHKERQFVTDAFSSVLGTQVEIRAVMNVDKGNLPSHLKPDGMVAVARELGGELKN